MLPEELQPNITIHGPFFPEPVQVIIAVPMGASVKLIGKGVRSSTVYEPILSTEQLVQLHASPSKEPFDGDAGKFRLGVEAMRLGLAYEYDPYFSLSIARVDPLPHQLEAVYDYFIKLPRIRFLLADDPGAGKTIMAGLLIKELKIRGLVKRTLIVTPANLSFQWQRELKDKFRESFEVVRSDVLRANYGMNPWQEKNQVITSVSWVSRVEDAKESLLRSNWDLIIVDEAHKMSAYSSEKKTLAYQLGDLLKRAAEASIVFAALLYVIGWSYLDGYYAAFGLKVGQLGVSNQEAAISSFRFIFHSVSSTLFFCLGTLIVGFAIGYFYGRLGSRREWLVISFLLVLFCVAGLLWYRAALFGRETAWRDMRTNSTTLPRVEVEIDRTKMSDNLVHYRELESKEYRLLLQTDNRIWLFKSADQIKGVFSVVTIPKEALRVMTIERATPQGGDQ